LICGCMFSGKSERLLDCLAEAKSHSIPAIAFTHADDDRYAKGKIVTHNGRHCDAVPVHTVSKIIDQVGNARLVVIDEAQFFADDLAEVCKRLAEAGRDVVVAGLDLDSWGLPFGPVPQIETIADEVIHTFAVCSVCGSRADHTQRLAPIEGQKMIGGPEAYEPRCNKCFQAPPIELRR